MSNILQRLITGFFFVLVLVGGMVWNRYSFGALFLLITVLSLIEFYGLIKNSKWNIQPQMGQGVGAGALLFITNYLVAFGFLIPKWLVVNVFALVLIFISELYRKKENPFANISFTVLGIIYLAIPFSLVSYITTPAVADDLGTVAAGHVVFYPWIIFGSFMIVWANDSWAYLGGRWFGKHKLFERISPGKTWQGSIVGGLVALLFGYLMSLFFVEYDLVDWLVIAAILIVTSTLGDLVESMLKRSLGVKDSGNMLPGHGGVLDRFDGMFLALPTIWVYLFLTN